MGADSAMLSAMSLTRIVEMSPRPDNNDKGESELIGMAAPDTVTLP